MSFGLQNGELVEVRWSSVLEDEVRRWLEVDAQLPATTAAMFGNPVTLSAALSQREQKITLALRRLEEILKRHRTPVIDADMALAATRLCGGSGVDLPTPKAYEKNPTHDRYEDKAGAAGGGGKTQGVEEGARAVAGEGSGEARRQLAHPAKLGAGQHGGEPGAAAAGIATKDTEKRR